MTRFDRALVNLAAIAVFFGIPVAVHSFVPQGSTAAFVTKPHQPPSPIFMSSFAADGSEYSSKDSGDYDDDDLMNSRDFSGGLNDDGEEDAPVQELSPVPMSKNSGNRFVALMWDQDLDTKGRDPQILHYERNEIVEDHVLFCRKRNLYNETFNSDSMVDILRSLPM